MMATDHYMSAEGLRCLELQPVVNGPLLYKMCKSRLPRRKHGVLQISNINGYNRDEYVVFVCICFHY